MSLSSILPLFLVCFIEISKVLCDSGVVDVVDDILDSILYLEKWQHGQYTTQRGKKRKICLENCNNIETWFREKGKRTIKIVRKNKMCTSTRKINQIKRIKTGDAGAARGTGGWTDVADVLANAR